MLKQKELRKKLFDSKDWHQILISSMFEPYIGITTTPVHTFTHKGCIEINNYV